MEFESPEVTVNLAKWLQIFNSFLAKYSDDIGTILIFNGKLPRAIFVFRKKYDQEELIKFWVESVLNLPHGTES